eukprot:755613-Hanusia_phi.AAC.1
MSMSMDRRQVVQGAALAGAVAPFLGGVQQASAAAKMPADSYTPIITIFDARGCPRGAGEYQGSPAGDNNDEMAVKVVLRKLEPDAGLAEQIKAETLGLMSKGPTQSGFLKLASAALELRMLCAQVSASRFAPADDVGRLQFTCIATQLKPRRTLERRYIRSFDAVLAISCDNRAAGKCSKMSLSAGRQSE